ncbi:MAG: LytTR family transcriptional regulator [Flavobacterium sp.]|nr:LytTR family transcriptional regulator [Flavobacterium sp.]
MKPINPIQYRKKSSKIVLPIGNSLEFFEPNDIIRFESDSNYTHVFLVNKNKITLCKTLKDVEENIQGEPFFRVHQSHLINTNFIDKIIKAETPYIVLKDGVTVNISRHKKEAFFDFFRKL